MTDHRTALATIPMARRADLHRRSDAKGLLHLACYLAALTVTGLWIALQGPFWGLVLFPHGVMLVFLFTLSHEATHQTPFKTRWINEAVGHGIAPVLALPFLWFRYFHLAHHKYTNDPDRDPEIVDQPRPTTWRSYLIYLSGWGYWSGMLRTLGRLARGHTSAPYLPKRKAKLFVREARLVLLAQALLLSTLFWSPLVLWLWLLPVLVAQPVLRLYLLAEHGLCPPVANMLENTRTTYTGRCLRWLAWNMPYHIEHHCAPNVPFHQLPHLHATLRPYLVNTSEGYRAFTRDYVQRLER